MPTKNFKKSNPNALKLISSFYPPIVGELTVELPWQLKLEFTKYVQMAIPFLDAKQFVEAHSDERIAYLSLYPIVQFNNNRVERIYESHRELWTKLQGHLGKEFYPDPLLTVVFCNTFPHSINETVIEMVRGEGIQEDLQMPDFDDEVRVYKLPNQLLRKKGQEYLVEKVRTLRGVVIAESSLTLKDNIDNVIRLSDYR